MPLPRAVIAYVSAEHRAARLASERPVEALDSLALALSAMKCCREIQSSGGSILYVDFVTDGITRRRYVDGRVGRGFVRPEVLTNADQAGTLDRTIRPREDYRQ